MVRISKRKFDEQIASFRQHRAVDDIGARIIVAAGQVIVGRRERDGLTDYHVTNDDIADFFDGLDRAQMRKLRRIAEGILHVGPVPGPLTRQ